MKEEEHATDTELGKAIRFLIEPSRDFVDVQRRRQMRLLSALLLIILAVGSVSALVQLWLVPGFLVTFVVIAGALFAMSIAYALARTRHYLAAAVVACLAPSVASYAILLTNPRDQSAFVYLLVGVLLSSMLLGLRPTLGFAALNLIGLLVLPILQPAWTPSLVAAKMGFHILIPALIVLAMKQRDLVERDRREDLLESELKFRSIFNSSVDAIGVSKAGIHVMANPAYLRMFGYESADELAGRPILDLIAPSEHARIAEKVQRRFVGEPAPAHYETRGRRRDGSEFDLEVHVSTYELRGEPYTVPILRDITERKRVERSLQESEQRYRMLFEANPHPMWVYDLESLAFLTVNDAAVARYGYSRDEFARLTIRDIRPSEDIPRLLSHLGSLSGGLDLAGQWRHRLKDGTVIDVEITSHPFAFDGRPSELVLSHDITERLKAQRELEENRRRLAFLIAKSPSVVYSSRAEGDFGATFVAANVTEQLGYQPEEFTRDPKFWLDRVHPDDRARVLSDLDRLFEDEAFAYEYRFRHLDGHYVWMRDEMTLIRDDSGRPREIVGAWTDVTSRKEAEAEREALINELTQRNAELDRFAYTVSHDLKSPLVTISGFLGFLAQDAVSGDTQRLTRDIERIQGAVARMRILLNEVLELSRVGRAMREPETVLFGEVVKEALEIVKGGLEERGVEVEVETSLPAVRGDRARLTQLLQNLIENAAKFMGDQSRPRIEIGRRVDEAGPAVFYVKDNGVGIAPEFHERVFGLFDKLDKASDGTGVGLALVKRIVEVHGGRIWVESQPGNGATFLFTLSAGPGPEGRARESGPRPAGEAPRTGAAG